MRKTEQITNQMQKRIVYKEDGRKLIYYSFGPACDTATDAGQNTEKFRLQSNIDSAERLQAEEQ